MKHLYYVLYNVNKSLCFIQPIFSYVDTSIIVYITFIFSLWSGHRSDYTYSGGHQHFVYYSGKCIYTSGLSQLFPSSKAGKVDCVAL